MNTERHTTAKQKKTLLKSRLYLFFAIGLFLVLYPFPAVAVQVTNGNDSSVGSLRQVIAAAASGETITFAAGVTSVTLTGGELSIAKNLTIEGSGIGGACP